MSTKFLARVHGIQPVPKYS